MPTRGPFARFYLGVAKDITVLHKVFGDASALRDIVKISGKQTGWRKQA